MMTCHIFSYYNTKGVTRTSFLLEAEKVPPQIEVGLDAEI
jgi:hypothetical protein